MSRLLLPSLLLLLSACSYQAGLLDADLDVELFDGLPTADLAPGEAVYVEPGEELAEGVLLSGDRPFRSFSLVVTAPEGAEFSLRHPAEGGGMGDWRPVQIDEDLGIYRSGHQVLPYPVDFAELRAIGGATFVEVVLYEGAEPLPDDEPGDGSGWGDEDDDARDAEAGPWTLPYATWLAGQDQYLPYVGASSCTGSLSAGARALGEYLVEHTAATSFGGYNCRFIGNSSSRSVHSEGRAIDVYVPMDGSGAAAADNGLGDPIGNWLVENAETIGISYVIWDQASWGAHRGGDKHRSYGGAHPHNNHLHVELTWAAASQSTEWFGATDAPGPLDAEGAGDRYLVGDWDGDGRDNLAVRRSHVVLMDTDFDGTADMVQAYGDGEAEDEYLVGDWDGDGSSNLAVRRGGTILMDTDGDAAADLEQGYGDGDTEDEYLVGDWNGDGTDDLAVRRGDTVFMDTDGDWEADLIQVYGNGEAEDEYLVGDWDGDGRDNLAVRRGAWLYLDVDFVGGAEIVRAYGDGGAEDEYLVGDWDGDGTDDLAVRRGDTVLMETSGDGIADILQTYGEG